ncbi:hypothetical protein AVW11_03815 [Streptomyces amritsarensis]|uniref:Uncharacterized protein n=1 Tax=Streptomyces amritsarensis TaxID=681158 RepID=A0ABX3G8Q9_9ACTN|nr:hypothetical protein [Streptomyces amritsarensis]OLZ72529.1 hypothetical protein AVW11_03815 [Streptomyces amritsarensis]
MTLTPDEAREPANALLASLYANLSDWTEARYDQAVAAIAGDGQPFSMNDIRAVLPGSQHHQAGLYFHSLLMRKASPLVHVGYVRSINPKARGKVVNTYRLTMSGREFMKTRRAERAQHDARMAARQELAA